MEIKIKSHVKDNNFDHIVMEDLSQMDSSFIKMENGTKYSRFISLIGLSGLKSRVRSIASKYNQQVTFVQSHYTSQQCNNCGHISKENRKSQEEFECVNCNHQDNADNNASLNIRNRVTLNVLRSKLLKENKNGELEPIKNLSKEIGRA